MFYCNGKKNFCTHPDECSEDCTYFNGEGGEEVSIPLGAPRWWLLLFRLKKRLKSSWYKIRRK